MPKRYKAATTRCNYTKVFRRKTMKRRKATRRKATTTRNAKPKKKASTKKHYVGRGGQTTKWWWSNARKERARKEEEEKEAERKKKIENVIYEILKAKQYIGNKMEFEEKINNIDDISELEKIIEEFVNKMHSIDELENTENNEIETDMTTRMQNIDNLTTDEEEYIKTQVTKAIQDKRLFEKIRRIQYIKKHIISLNVKKETEEIMNEENESILNEKLKEKEDELKTSNIKKNRMMGWKDYVFTKEDQIEHNLLLPMIGIIKGRIEMIQKKKEESIHSTDDNNAFNDLTEDLPRITNEIVVSDSHT